jgi:hypothetical protein
MAYYSVDNGDMGEVRLNGEIVEHSIACNTEHGWVECAVKPFTVHSGRIVTKVLHGDVTFVRFVKV